MNPLKIEKDRLSLIFEKLRENYTIVGPNIIDGTILLSEINFSDIPSGYIDIHGNGNYRLTSPAGDNRMVFTFTIGPDSFKKFLHPPVMELFSFRKRKDSLTVSTLYNDMKPYAFFGMRACDISGLKILDHVFLHGGIVEHNYERLRRESIIIGVNCIRPNDNCFCSSMNTGPEIKDGSDIIITELSDGFLLEPQTMRGRKFINEIPSEMAHETDFEEKRLRIDECMRILKKFINYDALPDSILNNLEHSGWKSIEERCLACGNCTNVCPTCFCNTTYDYVDISGISRRLTHITGKKIRVWDSCFSKNFARVHGGNFRTSRRARYRHWIAHKLAYWFREIGMPNCVGCGRCITWCPARIDITEEVRTLR